MLNYNEIVTLMKEFGIDYLNRFDELIIDEHTNTYVYIGGYHNIDQVKTGLVYGLCRPVGKGLDIKNANRLLDKLNKYFELNLTRKDCLLMYQELCYDRKLEEFEKFIKDRFPIYKLEEGK